MRCRGCNRTLTDPDSVKQGIGPVCAEKARRMADVPLFPKVHPLRPRTDGIRSYVCGGRLVKRFPDAKIVCECGSAECIHIQAVLEFMKNDEAKSDR